MSGDHDDPGGGPHPTATVGPHLSSVATALAELTTRLGDLAESLAQTTSDDVANGLFEVERLLRTAGRRLDKVVDELAVPGSPGWGSGGGRSRRTPPRRP